VILVHADLPAPLDTEGLKARQHYFVRNPSRENMATALKRTVYTRTSGEAVPAVREAADPALQRFLDAVWDGARPLGEYPGGVPGRFDRIGTRLEERDSALLKATRIECSASLPLVSRWIPSQIDRPATVELPPIFPIHGARRD